MKNIVLIGFMGTGKTSTGKALAVKLGYAFLDIDQKIEEEYGMSIPRMFSLSEQGDPAAREVGDALADTFASALHNIALVFDPDCVIFQGDYAHADRAFFIRLKQSLSGFNYYPGTTPFAIRRDMRPLEEMDAEGAFIALDHLYFDSDDLYRQDGQGPEEEA